jgi:cystathionine beta-lyase
MSPSKTFNIAGLECAFAVIPDPALRRRFEKARADLVPGISLLAAAAALAAYREGQPWLDALLPYLESNRDFLLEFAREHLPGIRVTRPEGTYLAWLDCRHAGLPAKPAKFFLKEGLVALNPGESFGPGGEGFVRLNFGCPRSTLVEGLRRMAAALARQGHRNP